MYLRKNEQVIRDVVTQASGEMALKEFLNQVKKYGSVMFLNFSIIKINVILLKIWMNF